jgi:hypothetical protein
VGLLTQVVAEFSLAGPVGHSPSDWIPLFESGPG